MWRKWIHLERILKLRKIKITRGINPKKEKKSQSIMKKDPFYRILSFTLKGNLLTKASLEILDAAQIELMLVWWLRCSAPRHRETVAKPLAQTQTTLHNQSKIWLSLQNICWHFLFACLKKQKWAFLNVCKLRPLPCSESRDKIPSHLWKPPMSKCGSIWYILSATLDRLVSRNTWENVFFFLILDQISFHIPNKARCVVLSGILTIF